LTLGSVAGIAASLGSTLLLDRLLGLHGSMAQSLLARSVSTPFALEATRHLGGSAQLTGVFVIITGLFGILLGQTLLAILPLRMRMHAARHTARRRMVSA
jgi:putative effector of murein hydrolase